ncbi:MAG TPA: lipoyl synthase [Parachlamydiaceae bacterium]|nr:lipoyl synthase [Parachlamydiaceae bacterium]
MSNCSKNRLNILPENPEKETMGRFPSWLHRKIPEGLNKQLTSSILEKNRLHTVCEEAKCPNLPECWAKKSATFLIMGKECTRSCGFCSIDFSKTPKALDPLEPNRVAESVEALELKHVVITMVARDDLEDGGAFHLKETIHALRRLKNPPTIEVLTSDFNGNAAALDSVIEARPEIFNYNIETVRSLTKRVRHTATYERTLWLLSYVKSKASNFPMFVKSGLMVGLGEEESEVKETISDLKKAGCDIITIGQYLQSGRHKLLVKSFITPEQFKKYEEFGHALGIKHMYCGPFVRSSYNAHLVFNQTTFINSH